MSPAFWAIRGANFFRFKSVPYLSEYVCQIWLLSDIRVGYPTLVSEKNGGGGVQTDRHTETKGHCSYIQWMFSLQASSVSMHGVYVQGLG